MTGQAPKPGWTAVLVVAAGLVVAVPITTFAATSIAMLGSDRFMESETVLMVWRSSLLASLYGLLLVAAALIVRQSHVPIVAKPMMVYAAMAIVSAPSLAVWLIWNYHQTTIDTDDQIIASLVGLTLIALALFQNGVFTCVVARSGVLRVAAVLLAALAWCSVLPFIIALARIALWQDETVLMFLGPFASVLSIFVLLASAVLLAAIVGSNRKLKEARESISGRAALKFECPKCGEAQSHHAGSHRCRGCGLFMNIDIEEPRCECGYLLYQLQSPTCPECGRPVPAQHVAPAPTAESGPVSPPASVEES